MEFSSLGKWIVLMGVALIVVGGAIWLLGKTGLPFGQLPGDISVDRKNVSFRFPIVTCIVLSILLTVVLNVLLRIFRG